MFGRSFYFSCIHETGNVDRGCVCFLRPTAHIPEYYLKLRHVQGQGTVPQIKPHTGSTPEIKPQAETLPQIKLPTGTPPQIKSHTGQYLTLNLDLILTSSLDNNRRSSRHYIIWSELKAVSLNRSHVSK
jgi:hypothetical protein